MAPRSIEESTLRFLDALAWNWIIGGTDAHAKNYALLLAGDEVRLAPLYDIASALPYGMHERKLRFAMKIGGDYRVYLHYNTWPALAAELDLDGDMVVERVAGLAARAPDAFADAASTLDVEMIQRPLPQRLVDLVADRSKRCLRLLAGVSCAQQRGHWR
jgi:serine/threonine-protein kinase HipA